MRVLLVNKYHHLRSGTERYLFNLKRLLESRGHRVEVFAMDHPLNEPATYSRWFVPYMDFHAIRPEGFVEAARRVIWDPGAARRIASVLDEFRPDMVHILNIYHHISPSILLSIGRRGIPVVQTLNDYKLICPNYLLYTRGAPCTRCRRGGYLQAFWHRCLHGSPSWSLLAALEMSLHKAWRVYERHVAIFIAPSLFVKEMVESFGLPQGNSTHIPYFLFPREYEVTRGDEGYIAYMGRLSREKGLETLLRAMRQVPEVPLRIVGEGVMRPSLEKSVEESALRNVSFMGHLGGMELRRLLAGARFTVLPSEWYEVFGQSILESFAAGKPVVAARIGGIGEVVGDGPDAGGLLFAPGAAEELAGCIRRLWHHPGEARDMGERGRRRVLECGFDDESHYHRIVSLYQGLVS
jgi:glycosyltransferase involved in cell wall biosynthesis